MTDIAKPEGGRADGPRYARIQRALEGRVRDGTYPVGGLMPTEIELSAEFETSRFTVREALRQLTEAGFVERRQGVGTRVISADPKVRYSQSFDSLDELFQVAKRTWYVVTGWEGVILDHALAEIASGGVGERWIRVDGVRWTEPGGRPICYIESYVPERFEALVPRFRQVEGALFQFLEQESGETIEQCEQEISARPMPEPFQRALGLKPGSWALQLARRYRTRGGVLIASCNWHPSDQMRYEMTIRRNRAE